MAFCSNQTVALIWTPILQTDLENLAQNCHKMTKYIIIIFFSQVSQTFLEKLKLKLIGTYKMLCSFKPRMLLWARINVYAGASLPH